MNNALNQLLKVLGTIGLLSSFAFFALGVIIAWYGSRFTGQVNVVACIKLVAVLIIPVGLSVTAIVIGKNNLRR
jgi:hypothetical protein